MDCCLKYYDYIWDLKQVDDNFYKKFMGKDVSPFGEKGFVSSNIVIRFIILYIFTSFELRFR